MKNIKPAISTTIILIWCLLCSVVGKSENHTVLRYDKIVFSTNQAGPKKGRTSKRVIVNSDRSTIVAAYKLSEEQTNCYNSTIQQGIVNEEVFNKMAVLIRGISNNSWEYVKPTLDADKADSYTIYEFLFMQDGVIKYAVSTYDHSFSAELRKLSLLFETIDSNMRVTKSKPLMSIAGLDSSYTYLSGFFPIENNSIVPIDKKSIRLFSAEVYLLWNYLRKANIISTTEEPLLFRFRYKPLEICQNGIPINGNLKINGTWELVRQGETDGRYFRFIADSGISVTLDIGFNFFTHTMKNYTQKRVFDW